MTNTKPWWQSKGVVGGLVAVVVMILGAFDVRVSESEIEPIVQQLIAACAAAFGVYGRVKADRRVE